MDPARTVRAERSHAITGFASLSGTARKLALRAEQVLRLDLPIAEPMPSPDPAPDWKAKLLIRDRNGTPRAVVQWSGPLAPAMMTRTLARAEEIRSAVSPEAAAAIIQPLDSGEIDGTSFAIWPFCEPITSSGRIGKWITRRALTAPLLDWLDQVARDTARPARPDELPRFERILRAMAEHDVLTQRSRDAAAETLTALTRGAWTPLHVAMHSDLWEGNVLIDGTGITGRADQSWPRRFTIIDWSGALGDGFPVYDWIRLATSLRVPDARSGPALARHATALGCSLADTRRHLVAALADLGANLEYFPVERYARLADDMIERLDRVLQTTLLGGGPLR